MKEGRATEGEGHTPAVNYNRQITSAVKQSTHTFYLAAQK